MDHHNPWHILCNTPPVSVSPNQLTQLKRLYQLVIEGNKAANLTRITDESDFVVSHLLDALMLVPLIQARSNCHRLMDVGSGAGFPALPLAIILPEMAVVAVESVQKKAVFIDQTAQQLGLSNVVVMPQRSETLAHEPSYREEMDVVVARAVAPLAVLMELCLPFIKIEGAFLAMKTQSALETELPEAHYALEQLGGKLHEVYQMPSTLLGERCVCVIDKIQPSPSAYPRKSGVPSKRPLLSS